MDRKNSPGLLGQVEQQAGSSKAGRAVLSTACTGPTLRLSTDAHPSS